MTSHKRFLLGGSGALMPVLVSFLAVDIGAALNSEFYLTTANMVGIAIRYVILFIIGGVIAYLHEDEHKPFKLFELGIAAPALITSLITAQGVMVEDSSSTQSTSSYDFSIISLAHATTRDNEGYPLIVAWRLNEIFDGLSGIAYKKAQKSVEYDGQDSKKEVDEVPDEEQYVDHTREESDTQMDQLSEHDK